MKVSLFRIQYGSLNTTDFSITEREMSFRLSRSGL